MIEHDFLKNNIPLGIYGEKALQFMRELYPAVSSKDHFIRKYRLATNDDLLICAACQQAARLPSGEIAVFYSSLHTDNPKSSLIKNVNPVHTAMSTIVVKTFKSKLAAIIRHFLERQSVYDTVCKKNKEKESSFRIGVVQYTWVKIQNPNDLVSEYKLYCKYPSDEHISEVPENEMPINAVFRKYKYTNDSSLISTYGKYRNTKFLNTSFTVKEARCFYDVLVGRKCIEAFYPAEMLEAFKGIRNDIISEQVLNIRLENIAEFYSKHFNQIISDNYNITLFMRSCGVININKPNIPYPVISDSSDYQQVLRSIKAIQNTHRIYSEQVKQTNEKYASELKHIDEYFTPALPSLSPYARNIKMDGNAP